MSGHGSTKGGRSGEDDHGRDPAGSASQERRRQQVSGQQRGRREGARSAANREVNGDRRPGTLPLNVVPWHGAR